MKKLVREPLVHFLLLGAALFGVYAALNKDNVASQEDIVVTTGQIENLAATFARLWQRPPTDAELRELIDGYVKEEILSREAIKLHLDQNDTVIRRRLQQKMEFIAEDFAAASEPTDAELADYLAKHPGQFAQEQRFTFQPGVRKRVHRGGSFLCTDKYCSRYMVGTRGKGEPDTGTNHLGFRCVKPVSLPSSKGQS